MGEKLRDLLNAVGVGVLATLVLVVVLTDVAPSELRSVSWWSLCTIGAVQLTSAGLVALGVGSLDPGAVSRRYWALCLALTGATWIAMAWWSSLIVLPAYSVVPEWKLLAGVIYLSGWPLVSWAGKRARGRHLTGDEDAPSAADSALRSGNLH